MNKKIAIFLPNQSYFYQTLFIGMKTGFEKAGLTVTGQLTLLKRKELLEFCKTVKPDILLEMNRSRAQVPFLPKNIIHIGWIVDLLGHPYNYFRDSDILYLFGFEWVDRYMKQWRSANNTSLPNKVKWLPPGFSPEIYYPKVMETITDFSFVGHIPLPWTQKELYRIVGYRNDTPIFFKDVWQFCCKPGNQRINKRLDESVFEYIQKQTNNKNNVPIKNQSLKYDLNVRIGRMLNRELMMDCLLSTKKSIHIYGPEHWKEWPNYKPYYKYYITDPNDIRKVFLSSSINIHEGNGAHFRAFDSMGSGGCLFYYKNPYNAVDSSGLEAIFQAGKHYVAFNHNDIAGKAQYYLKNKEARDKIGDTARKLVYQKHKWSDRATQITQDIKTIL